MRGDHRGRHTEGFTLIEVVVALTIGALVVLLAHQVFTAVADGGRALVAARAGLDRERNARRWLAATFLSLEVGVDSADGFDGRPDRVDFAAWEETRDGWFEQRRVTLMADGHRLVAALDPGELVTLRDSIGAVGFDYLLEPGLDAHWVREWVSPVSAPLAVRMRIEHAGCERRDAGCVVDTLLFLITARG